MALKGSSLTKTLTKTLAILIVLAVMATGASAQSTGRRTAFVSVGDVTVTAGETFTVPVWITGVINLYGADVKLVYDNTILQGVSVDRGTLLKPDYVMQQGFYGPPFCTGPCARYAMTQIWPTHPVTGNGIFMIVRFTALQPGTSPLALQDVKLSDHSGALLRMNVRSGTVTVVAD